MVKQKSLKGPNEKGLDPVYNMDKFIGEGIMFKCKLFGYLKVEGPKGDEICAEAIARLKQQAKQLNKESKIHKQRIFLNISLKGIRIIDQQTRKLEHAHVVHKISYISHDKDDRRTFGYIVSLPEGYHLFAFKAEKNAGSITTNLKELFHVVFLKHKHEREKGKNGNTDELQGTVEKTELGGGDIQEGKEATEEEKTEDPYAVPMKFQLFEKKPDTINEYAVPSSIPLVEENDTQAEGQGNTDNDAANLLDWADTNQELEFMQKDMKRSDTKQLLAELGDFSLDSNPFQKKESQNVFSDDPFFKSAGVSDEFSGGTNNFSSNPDLKQNNDPFFPAADDFSSEPSNLSKSKSVEFGLFDSTDAFSPTKEEPKSATTQPFLTEVGDLFSTVPASHPATVPTNTGWSSSFGTENGQQFPTLTPKVNENSLFSSDNQVPSVDLVPEKLSEPKAGNDDPFAALSGGISDIRGTLPSGGNVAQFPKKEKPVPTSYADTQRVVSPGPSIPPNQQPSSGFGQQQYGQQAGFSQNNPFNQQTMQGNAGFSQRFNPPPVPSRPDMPPIPMRQDLMPGLGGFQTFPQMQQQQHVPPMPKPYSQIGQSSFQMQGNNFGNGPAMTSPSSQTNVDPFAGLGGAFSVGSTVPAEEPLYAVVDKSKKTTHNQTNADVFGMFDTTSSLNGGLNSTNPTSSNTGSNSASDQDPFGFGF